MDGANLGGTDYKQLSDALQESVDLLREEIGRLRKTASVLRSVNSQLRSKIESLMKEKDELFLEFCDKYKPYWIEPSTGDIRNKEGEILCQADDSI
jgi:hypothetical protein